MPNLGQTLGTKFLKVCKTCGTVNNHPYRYTHCEKKAADAARLRQQKKNEGKR